MATNDGTSRCVTGQKGCRMVRRVRCGRAEPIRLMVGAALAGVVIRLSHVRSAKTTRAREAPAQFPNRALSSSLRSGTASCSASVQSPSSVPSRPHRASSSSLTGRPSSSSSATCTICGRAADPRAGRDPPFTSCTNTVEGVDGPPTTWVCGECARGRIRRIEAELDRAWWWER